MGGVAKIVVGATVANINLSSTVAKIVIGRPFSSLPTTYPAEDVTIIDAGNHYTIKNVEGALQEAGASIATNTANIATNTANIATNTADIATNTGDIATLQGEVYALQSATSGFTPTAVIVADGSGNLSSSASAFIDGGTLTADDFYSDGDISTSSVIGRVSVNSPRFTSTKQTLAIVAGNVAWNMANGQTATLTLTSAATLQNPTNLPAGTDAIFPSLEVVQGGSGGYTLSFGSAYKFPSTYVAPGTALGSRTIYNFYLRSDGNVGVVSTYYAS